MPIHPVCIFLNIDISSPPREGGDHSLNLLKRQKLVMIWNDVSHECKAITFFALVSYLAAILITFKIASLGCLVHLSE